MTLKIVLIYLTVLGPSCSTQDLLAMNLQLQHVEPSSLTRECTSTPTLRTGREKSRPLDHQ